MAQRTSPSIAKSSRRLALFLVMLLSGGQLIFPRVPLLIAYLILVLTLRESPIRRLHKAILPAAALALTSLLIESLRANADITQIATRGANFLSAILLLNTYLIAGLENFEKDAFVITKFFTAQTIATVFAAAIAPWMFLQISGTPVQTLGFILYYHQESVISGLHIVRPDGFFWEPGVLQIYLNICLFLSLWVFRSRLVAAAAIIAIALTQSTTGMIILALQLFTYVIQPRQIRRGIKPHLKLLILGPIFAPLFFLAFQNIEEKLHGDLQGSFYARAYDAQAGMNLIVQNPWIGIGFNPQEYLNRTQDYDIDVGRYTADAFNQIRGNTNGIVILLFSLGIPLGSLLILGLMAQTAFNSRVVIPAMLIISLLSEPLTLTPFFLFFAFSVSTRVGRRPKNSHGPQNRLAPQ